MEIWKDIKGFEEKYQISTWGRVRNKQTGKIKEPYMNKKGYLKVGLWNGEKNAKYRINRLVAMAFIPNIYDLPQVNHKDGNKLNNSYTNLEWVTDRQNKDHRRMMQNAVKYVKEMKSEDRSD